MAPSWPAVGPRLALLAPGWPLLVPGWPPSGPWLASRRPPAGPCLAPGWPLVGPRLASIWYLFGLILKMVIWFQMLLPVLIINKMVIWFEIWFGFSVDVFDSTFSLVHCIVIFLLKCCLLYSSFGFMLFISKSPFDLFP